MPVPSTLDVCKVDLFLDADKLNAKYDDVTIARILRIRDMYTYKIQYPECPDRRFIEEEMSRYGVSQSSAYSDLSIIKQLLPLLTSASREYHRWRANEMLLETYAKAKKRNDTRAMEAAARDYAKFNRVDLEDERAIPYDEIVIQPFTATSDPTVLGIKPIPNLKERIKTLIEKYKAETIDIEDVEFEEADIEVQLFDETEDDKAQPQHIL